MDYSLLTSFLQMKMETLPEFWHTMIHSGISF